MGPKSENKKRIKVLVVEDSPTISLYLKYLFDSDSDIEVIGMVKNGKMAVEFVKHNKPDIITMDIDMPVMNGFDATKIIMSTTPVPIIIITASRNARKQNTSMDALAAGALAVIQKPSGIKLGNKDAQNRQLLSMVKVYSQVKVIKRRYTPSNVLVGNKNLSEGKSIRPSSQRFRNRNCLAIGVSTGGPEVLKNILGGVSQKFPLPIVVVQHISDGFLESMVAWLNDSCEINVRVAVQGEELLPGNVYFAPSKSDMGVSQNKVELHKAHSKNKICPSVECLFKSLLNDNPQKTIAMLLTGMGSDGAKELKMLKDAGALTIAQDKDSSLVHGMPGKAIELNGADYVLNPTQILQILKGIEQDLLKEETSQRLI